MEGTLGLPTFLESRKAVRRALPRKSYFAAMRGVGPVKPRPLRTPFTSGIKVKLLVWHSGFFSGIPNLSLHTPPLPGWFLPWLQAPLSPFLGSPFSISPVSAPSLSQGLLWDSNFLSIPALSTLSHHCLFVCLLSPRMGRQCVFCLYILAPNTGGRLIKLC